MSETPPNNSLEAKVSAAKADIFALICQRVQAGEIKSVDERKPAEYVAKIPEMSWIASAHIPISEIDNPTSVEVFDYRGDTHRGVLYYMSPTDIEVRHYGIDAPDSSVPFDEKYPKHPIDYEELIELHSRLFPDGTPE